MDNFRIDITSEGRDKLLQALNLCQHNKVVAYGVEWSPTRRGVQRLVLFHTVVTPGERGLDGLNITPTLFPLTLEQMGELAFGWLAQCDYGEEPDHDGENHKGWRLYNEAWGHVRSDWRAFVAIEPAWAMYGK